MMVFQCRIRLPLRAGRRSPSRAHRDGAVGGAGTRDERQRDPRQSWPGRAVKRTILGFSPRRGWRLDRESRLRPQPTCAPPSALCEPPWVVSEARRKAMLGTALDRALRPDGVARGVRRLPPDAGVRREDGSPGLTSEHATKRGVWAKIHMICGALRYHVGPSLDRSFRVDPKSIAAIVPDVRHRVEPEGPVRFFVEFARARRAR